MSAGESELVLSCRTLASLALNTAANACEGRPQLVRSALPSTRNPLFSLRDNIGKIDRILARHADSPFASFYGDS
jgi:hypothetical protein